MHTRATRSVVGERGGPCTAVVSVTLAAVKQAPNDGRRSYGSVTRGDLQLTVDSDGLTLRALDYHCPPLHLRREELRQLGFVLLPVRRRLQPSAALAWRHAVNRWEPRGSLPQGLVLNGYVLARVRAGLDVFVTSCGAEELCVGPEELRRVGLPCAGKRSEGISIANCWRTCLGSSVVHTVDCKNRSTWVAVVAPSRRTAPGN